jgi:hypothetical protein
MSQQSEADLAYDVASHIYVVRGCRVLLDTDLALLYGVLPKRLNEAVRRNGARFPADFGFRLSAAEWRSLRSQIATLKTGRGAHRKHPPTVFTEHGALMAAMLLNSGRAVEMSVYVIRAFVRLRGVAAASPGLARKLAELENSIASLDRDTRQRFEHVYAAIRALTARPAAKSRPIGFTAPLE